MGGSSYSHADYAARTSYRKSTGTPTFAHTAAVISGKTAAKVHADLDPKGVGMRVARDSDLHPVTLPIIIPFDTTGSMRHVPEILEAKLSSLMGIFLNDKASGKKYLGDAYPAIMVGAVDDYDAMHDTMGGNGALQVGQFESGIEIDNDLEKIWLTGNGGGTYHESYELALYFAARHTAHDNWDKRGRKGYLFLIGDEHAYPKVSKHEVADIIGDTIEADIPLADILAEAQQRYHVFFILPNMTQHYNDKELAHYWMELLGQQNVLKLQDPNKICEMIASAVAIGEEHVDIDDLTADGVIDDGVKNALVPLAKAGAGLSKYSAGGLPPVSGTPGGTDRL